MKTSAMNHNNARKNKLSDKLGNFFRRRRRQHDPMLVLNMSIFNFEGGWSRIFNPIKVRENY